MITNRRLLKVTGILNKRSGDSSLEKINDAILSQTVLGRMLNFGDLEILTAAEHGRTTATTCSTTRRNSRRRCSPRSTARDRVHVRPRRRRRRCAPSADAPPPPAPPPARRSRAAADAPARRGRSRADGRAGRPCRSRGRPRLPAAAAADAATTSRSRSPRRWPAWPICATGRDHRRGIRAEEGRAARPAVVASSEQLVSAPRRGRDLHPRRVSRSTSSATPSPRIELGDSTAR